ncbi:hypothetical protein K6W36_10350 [Acetobacter senegalensis]|uniref:hypothetical protein n=1 Tax=Acetobacter senegalensis TaxID=446692 RepID=UPI001EDB2EFE|nr:hypothetical protein [Acetobacter senegalensis]MCG4260975.1 hypothetical protein [Acetobacter senegalensis]
MAVTENIGIIGNVGTSRVDAKGWERPDPGSKPGAPVLLLPLGIGGIDLEHQVALGGIVSFSASCAGWTWAARIDRLCGSTSVTRASSRGE